MGGEPRAAGVESDTVRARWRRYGETWEGGRGHPKEGDVKTWNWMAGMAAQAFISAGLTAIGAVSLSAGQQALTGGILVLVAILSYVMRREETK